MDIVDTLVVILMLIASEVIAQLMNMIENLENKLNKICSTKPVGGTKGEVYLLIDTPIVLGQMVYNPPKTEIGKES